MPIERCSIKDEPEHRINGENAVGAGMGGPFAEARKPVANPRVSFGMDPLLMPGERIRTFGRMT